MHQSSRLASQRRRNSSSVVSIQPLPRTIGHRKRRKSRKLKSAAALQTRLMDELKKGLYSTLLSVTYAVTGALEASYVAESLSTSMLLDLDQRLGVSKGDNHSAARSSSDIDDSSMSWSGPASWSASLNTSLENLYTSKDSSNLQQSIRVLDEMLAEKQGHDERFSAIDDPSLWYQDPIDVPFTATRRIDSMSNDIKPLDSNNTGSTVPFYSTFYSPSFGSPTDSSFASN
ncbi:hypothetical protein VNI00_010897 [Paramarasmius palmivorus]|uniref:Uncharacterized protein n=1 Tax=Paramarasmius palmivorus TaxID=297713 RepID=A0AAW0CF75_9AGAR